MLKDLTDEQLKVAQDATATLMRYHAYLPNGVTRMLVEKFQDDVHKALGMEAPARLPSRKVETQPLGSLTSGEFSQLMNAVMILLADCYTTDPDDPQLPAALNLFHYALIEERQERKREQATFGPGGS